MERRLTSEDKPYLKNIPKFVYDKNAARDILEMQPRKMKIQLFIEMVRNISEPEMKHI